MKRELQAVPQRVLGSARLPACWFLHSAKTNFALAEVRRVIAARLGSLFRQNAETSTPGGARSAIAVALLLALLALLPKAGAIDAAGLAAATVVVFNKDDADSRELARFYAQKRGIALDHVVGLACSTNEEISRLEYDHSIATPLRDIFMQRQWWKMRSENLTFTVERSSIRFVALIKGMPLKIRATTEPYPGDRNDGGPLSGHNEASVDSELAVMGRGTSQISGPAPNPYFQSYRAVTEETEPAMLLVCRLDAPAVATVKRMITDAIETEKSGLWGRAFVDGAHNTSGGFVMGDVWLSNVVEQLHKVGVPVVYDDLPEIFPNEYPISDCALYYGWYAGGVAGAFAQPTFRFLPGAIAVHIHSYSANTLRDPNANWVGPLLTHGAAASLGNVYEPYLQLTTHLDVFNDRLTHGFTFAESAYMGTQALSWMTIMVGDPLYRPYATWLQLDRPEPVKATADWRAYHEFAEKNDDWRTKEYRTRARQIASRTRNAPMIEDLGLMELREGHYALATEYFQQARTLYTKLDDILRVVLEQADSLVKEEKPKRALELVRGVLKVIPNAPAAALLKKVENELAPRAASPAPRS